MASRPHAAFQTPGLATQLSRGAHGRSRSGRSRSGSITLQSNKDDEYDPDHEKFMKVANELYAAFGDGIKTFGPGVPEIQDFESIPSRRAAVMCTRDLWYYIDVRNPEELVQMGRPDVPNYHNIPSHQNGWDELKFVTKVMETVPEKDAGIVVAGAVSVSTRAKAAAHALVQAGYTQVKEMEDGYIGWIQRGSDMTLYQTFTNVDELDEWGANPPPRVPAQNNPWRDSSPSEPVPLAPRPIDPNAEPKMTGICKMFNVDKGFGFITRDDGGPDVFVHQTSIYAQGYRSLSVGEPVEFNMEAQDNGKIKAVDVTGPGGHFVQGSARDGGWL